MEKNIIVTDENGNILGSTYPKRARGLIKSGRAELIDNDLNRIRLKTSRLDEKAFPLNTEDKVINMNIDINSEKETGIDFLTGKVVEKGGIDSVIDFVNSAEGVLDELTFNSLNEKTSDSTAAETAEKAAPESKKLFFLPRKWKFNSECPKNKGERTIITDMFGKLSEAFCIGNWNWDWTEIQSEMLVLEKNTDYVFSFWLNGGENDRQQETCRLEIIFDNDKDNCYSYKLNRDTIKPVKRYKGWVLFEIPFRTETNDYTRLKFAVMGAHTAILPALGKEAYANLPDDEIDPRLPQRHNIVYKDGYPRDSKWSYLVFGEETTGSAAGSNNYDNNNNNHFNGFENSFKNLGDMISDKVNIAVGFAENMAEKSRFFANNISKEVYEDILDDIEDEIKDEINDELRGEIKDFIKSQAIDEILNRFRMKK